ncbi:CooT family nickel-binding protein [Methanobacterium sp. CWC-01]|uniref:CooT family nickel-binding protein n=1 Tax=Methanobacterium aridiramus TaxID=2584467 RepID=UPI00257796B8|nr:CooT family nickel-binding protein [Methanobacterium sp. CWC-01]WJI09780.1 CooT family nickel-binding protein [Methanobacterium sp. CWC-01]
MCESSVYSTNGEKIMEDVISIKIDGENINLLDILNQPLSITGKIVEIDLDKHGIYVEVQD